MTIEAEIRTLECQCDACESTILTATTRLADLEAGRNCPPTVPAWLAEKASTSAALEAARQALATVQAELAGLKAKHGEAVETARIDTLIAKAQGMATDGLSQINLGLGAAWQGAELLGNAFDLLQPEAQRHPRLFQVMAKLPGGDLGEKLPAAVGFLTKPSATTNPVRKAS